MLSTSVYCAIHVTTVLVILIWAPGVTKGKGFCRSNQGRETCSTTEGMFCYSGQRPQIVDAYFVNAADHAVCGVNCKATQAPDGDFQCLADHTRTGFQCVQRLGYTDLVVVYNACDLSSHCRFSSLSDTNLLSLRSTFTVDYLCIQENSTIDPCLTFEGQRSHASLWLPYNTTSCHSVCEITPVNTERSVYFKYQLIQGFAKSAQVVHGNNIAYEITFTPSTRKKPHWEQFHSSYYDNYKLWQDVDKLRIRFNIPRGDIVRHLWISFHDTEVNIVCTGTNNSVSPPDSNTPIPDGPTKSKEDTEVNIVGTGATNNSVSPPDSNTPIPDGPTKSKEGEQLIITIVAVVLGVAGVCVAVAIIFIIRKRHGRQKRQRHAERKGGNNESRPENQTHASLPSPNDGDCYTECFMPDDSNPDPAPSRDPEAEPIVTTHPGDEYVTLQRDGRVGMAGRSEHNENYDHMPAGMRPRSDVYNVLQREQKKQEVVDNVYNTTYLTP